MSWTRGTRPGYSFWDADPSWSPDGTEIAFTSNRLDSYEFDVFTMPITGEDGDARNITNTVSAKMEQFPDWQPIPVEGPLDGDRQIGRAHV